MTGCTLVYDGARSTTPSRLQLPLPAPSCGVAMDKGARVGKVEEGARRFHCVCGAEARWHRPRSTSRKPTSRATGHEGVGFNTLPRARPSLVFSLLRDHSSVRLACDALGRHLGGSTRAREVCGARAAPPTRVVPPLGVPPRRALRSCTSAPRAVAQFFPSRPPAALLVPRLTCGPTT